MGFVLYRRYSILGLLAFERVRLIGREFGTLVVLEIGLERLIGDEITLQVVYVDPVAFESSANARAVGTADSVVGQQPVGVLSFAF